MAARPRSVLIVTDAWYPQVNGVVRTLDKTAEELRKLGITVDLITPAEFRTIPMPSYGEIGLSLTSREPVIRRVEAAIADSIHIATEGPLGWIVRNHCVRAGIPFSTAYHTQFPEYIRARVPVPLGASYRLTGPIDVSGTAPVGILDNDLRSAAVRALDVSRADCRRYAEGFSWASSTEQFLSHMPTIRCPWEAGSMSEWNR